MGMRYSIEMLFPFLLVAWMLIALLRNTGVFEGRKPFMVPTALLLAAIITLIPIRRLSVAHYILSVNPVFSMGSVCLAASLIWPHLRGRPLLSRMDLLLFSTWNISISLYVYLSYLGFIGYDLYSLGYGFSPLFVMTGTVTLILFLFRSPVAWIFTTYILAYIMKLLPSHNYVDYIVDVPLFIASLAIVATYSVQSIILMSRSRRTSHTAHP